MSYTNPYTVSMVSDLPEDARAQFIRKTYGHLAIALGLIVASFFLPISLGFWFSGAMILLASGAVLYNTSNLIHRYQPGQHVAAALSLFASVALLFWYVLRILMSLRR